MGFSKSVSFFYKFKLSLDSGHVLRKIFEIKGQISSSLFKETSVVILSDPFHSQRYPLKPEQNGFSFQQQKMHIRLSKCRPPVHWLIGDPLLIFRLSTIGL